MPRGREGFAERIFGHQLPQEDISALLEAQHAVNGALGVQDALHVVLGKAKELLEADEGSVMLLGNDGLLRVIVSEGIPTEIASQTSIPLGRGVSGRVAQTGLPVLLTARPAERDFESFVDKERHIESAVSVPLKAAGRTVGVLNLNITSPRRRFGERDMQFAQLFAEQAAMAIYKAQLLEQSQQRGDELSQLFDATRELVGVIDMEPLLTRVLEAAVKLLPSRAGFICLLDDSGGLSLGVYRSVARPDLRSVLSHPDFMSLTAREHFGILNPGEHPAFAAVASSTEGVAILPIRSQGRSRALVVLIGVEVATNSARLLTAFGAQAALAIGNAELYKRVDDKETELASIVYSMANPILVVDPAGHLLIANPAAEEVFGFASDWIKGTHVTRLFEDSQLTALLTGDIEGPIEIEAGRHHSQIWKARVSSVTSPDIQRQGRLLVLEDVTTDRETQRLKSDFVSIVGHELRTPLTSIKGYLRTLVTRGDRLTEDQRKEALITADAQTSRLERLIENLLYVSAIETTPSLHLESVDLMESVGVLIDEFRVREVQRPISAYGPGSLKILLDKTKVEQVLFHLLDNACKYSELDSPISVEVTDHPDKVEVSVTDKGVGILSGEIPRLFDRFHQIDASSTREHEGAGLGLYICKRFINAHGGDIEVTSAWGQGSTFSFSIPKNLAVEIRQKARAKPSTFDPNIAQEDG